MARRDLSCVVFTFNHLGLAPFIPACNVRALPNGYENLVSLANSSAARHATMDSIKNEFQGFEDGFEGFPKHLPDDCVEYSLFVIDSKLKSQKELRARLEAVRKESTKLTDSLLKDYIWQRDAFSLQFESGNGISCFRIYGNILTCFRQSYAPSWPDQLWRFCGR